MPKRITNPMFTILRLVADANRLRAWANEHGDLSQKQVARELDDHIASRAGYFIPSQDDNPLPSADHTTA